MSRAMPVKPMSHSVRYFAKYFANVQENDFKQKTSKFMDFIEKAEEIDRQIETAKAPQ